MGQQYHVNLGVIMKKKIGIKTAEQPDVLVSPKKMMSYITS